MRALVRTASQLERCPGLPLQESLASDLSSPVVQSLWDYAGGPACTRPRAPECRDRNEQLLKSTARRRELRSPSSRVRHTYLLLNVVK